MEKTLNKIWEWPGNKARQVQLRVIHCTGHVPTKTLVPYTTAMLDMSCAQEVMDVTKLDLGYISHTHVQYKAVIFTGNHTYYPQFVTTDCKLFLMKFFTIS